MALQTTTLTCNGSKKHHKFTLTVNEDSTSISDNTSTISFAFTISPINTGWNWASHSTIKYSVNINGQPYTGTILNYNGSSTVTLTSGTQVVAHDSSGNKSIDISFSVTDTSGASYTCGNASASGTMTLTNIARASSLTLSATSVNVGGSITATITRANSSFTHKVEFYINSTYYQSYTGVATSQSFTIPDSWYNYMSSSTSCTAYCRITTYNGNAVIGSTVQKSFAVNVPSTIKPVLGSITLDPADINGQNILVKSKNALTINVSGCSAGVGSTIKSYTFSGPSVSHTVNTTATSASASIAYISSVGALTYTVTVTDTRGRTASGSAAILCYDYYAPSFTSFNAYRADSNGNANAEGTYLKCVYTINYASVNDTNSATVTLRYTSSEESKVIEMSDGSALIDLGNNTASYQVVATVTDLYGGSAPSSELTILGDFRILNITSDGTGLAIGKMAESANLLDVVPPSRFRNTVTFDDPPIGEKTTLWYASQHPAPNDLLNVMLNGDYSADNMLPGYIATEDASTLVNSPITSGAFYAYREVEIYSVGHMCVRLKEMYPFNGRVWSNMYDKNVQGWYGWKCGAVAVEAEVGREQLTTETFAGKPVYTAIIDCGNFPSESTKTIGHGLGVSQIIRCVGINADYFGIVLPYTDPGNNLMMADVSAHKTIICVRCNTAAWSEFKCLVQLWYTK